MEDDAGGDEINKFDSKFIDGETNFQDQEPTNYCLMNVTRDLREVLTALPNLKFLKENQRINFIFSYFMQLIVI